MSKIIALLLALILTIAVITFLPVKAEAKTIIVPDDYLTISDAINNANEGDTVFVNKGSYDFQEGQILVISKSISLIGEDPNNTIINIHPRKIEPTLPFSMPYYEGSIKVEANDVRLSGFTINNGELFVAGMGNQITGNILATPLSLTGSYHNVSLNTVTQGIDSYGIENIIAHNRITGASQTINFTISPPKSEPFPIATIVVVSGTSLLAISIGFLVFFKKRKQKAER